MIFSIILTKIKSIILFFINRFRLALCCFRRRRRPSYDSEPLQCVSVVSNQTNELEPWNEWDDPLDSTPKTIKDHIKQYRAQKTILANQISMNDEDVNDNLFNDMAPKITRQKKVFVDKSNNGNKSVNNSLSLVPEVVNINGELGEWEENSGWEAQTQDMDVEDALRETKRLERERKMWEQQQRRMERNARPLSLGSKVIS